MFVGIVPVWNGTYPTMRLVGPRAVVGGLTTRSCSLLPYAVKADQTADRAGKTDDAVVEVDKTECAGRNSQIAQI